MTYNFNCHGDAMAHRAGEGSHFVCRDCAEDVHEMKAFSVFPSGYVCPDCHERRKELIDEALAAPPSPLFNLCADFLRAP